MAALTAALLLTSCSSGSSDNAPEAIRSTTSIIESSSPTTGSAPATDDEPSPSPSALDSQIAWVLDVLNGRSATSEAEVTQRFSAQFLTQVPAATFVAAISQLREISATWTAAASDGYQRSAEVRLTTESDPWIMRIRVAQDGLIKSLLLEPDSLGDVDELSSFDEIVEVLGRAGNVAMLAANVSGGICETIHRLTLRRRGRSDPTSSSTCSAH